MECFRKNMKAAVKGDDKMADLKAFDMVLFPVLEFNHYYVFELKNTSISVIDNFCDKYPFVRMLNNKKYFMKDSCYKIKELFVDYLEEKKHPKTDEIVTCNIHKDEEEDGCTYPALAGKYIGEKVVDVAQKKGKVVALVEMHKKRFTNTLQSPLVIGSDEEDNLILNDTLDEELDTPIRSIKKTMMKKNSIKGVEVDEDTLIVDNTIVDVGDGSSEDMDGVDGSSDYIEEFDSKVRRLQKTVGKKMLEKGADKQKKKAKESLADIGQNEVLANDFMP
ncbi:hypothetical protein L1987_74338 [Smallanthus sonchifolius]|uniref:Uncharacterized protein n=1 Tax=Smallanthus sonchifolius TaxID=185202 RepID=A0ACB9A3A5_9ASTR|nr:hypothetical protein L1987_74338 [Smallanthus sonchifolius]